MRKIITLLLLALTLVLATSVEVEPQMKYFNVFGDTTVTIIPNDTLTSEWLSGPGKFPDGTFNWSWEGDGSGSVDSLLAEIRRCYFTIDLFGGNLRPDSIYAEAWDTLVIATDSTSHLYLKSLTPNGWEMAPWVQFRWANIFDSDSCDLEKNNCYMAGSE